tara:strand:- start:415 stop:546 length:132 start_codon:yes stop_codon:yes gene_type:complete
MKLNEFEILCGELLLNPQAVIEDYPKVGKMSEKEAREFLAKNY